MVPHMAPRAVQNCIFTAWLGRYPAAIRIATSPTSCGSSCSNTAKVVATSCSWRPNATPMARPSVKLCVASATRLRNAALCSPHSGRNGLCKQTAGLRKSFGANDFATVSDAAAGVSSFACEGDGLRLREPRLPAGAFAAGLLAWAWA